MNLISTSTFTAVGNQLGLVPDTSKGFLDIDFRAATNLDGGFGASITLAHGQTFTVGNNLMPAYTDAGSAGPDGAGLIFPNVTPGTTTITLHPAPGYTCVLDRPLTVRVDPDVFTTTSAQCQ